MIFSVQRFLEDYFQRRGLADVDQYAIRVANAFDGLPAAADSDRVTREIAEIRTTFFRRNRDIDRREFEAGLASILCRRFKKKTNAAIDEFERGLSRARTRLRARRRSIHTLLGEFKHAIESRGVDAFWQARTQNRLRSRPESVAQALLAVFTKGVLGGRGFVLREFASGTGFVDVGVSFGGAIHLIELKILTGKFVGVNQLGQYMTLERRRKGWLVVIDTRPVNKRPSIPEKITIPSGLVRVVTIDVNPVAPHST